MMIVGVAAAVLATAAAVAADQKPDSAPKSVSRYSAVTRVPARAGGRETPLRVEVKDLFVVRTAEGIPLPAGTFTIAQLMSGQIEAEIGGKTQRYREGDIWAVAAGASMIIRFPPHRQAAQLRLLTVAPVTGPQ
jgi:hypothetical protein